MNKSALRNFAVWARRDLIKRISDRATLLGVYEDKPAKPIQAETQNGFVVNGVTFNYKKEMREAFINKVRELGYQDAIEEIAYTWFNRIVALRFMEVNGYLKNGKNGEQIYIIGSTVAGKTEPDAITYADKLSFVDKFKVYDYQDANNIDGLYRYILTKQCNDLNKVMPQMFVEIEDYIELMLPDHLLDKGAIIDRLLTDINAKDFNITVKDEDGENASQVEIVGWLYQFYISEKKDDVFAGLKNNVKIDKGTLPAATQIFTPDWIVRYMTDNTLGKMWVESRSSRLKKELKYYLEPAEQTEEVKQKLNEINKEYSKKSIKEITFIDPCCGSGHILVYAFDLLYKIYEESGFFASDIPALILQNNLIGIDIDKRAVQLTTFALTMKALSYDNDFLSKKIYPAVIDIKESNSVNINEVKEFIKLARLNNHDEELVLDLMEKFQDAELYGSLIKDFNYSPEDYDGLYQQITNTIHADEFFNIIDRSCVLNIKPILCDLLRQAYILSSKYDIVVTNPPYAGNSGFNDTMSKYAETFYKDSKYDMFAMFIEHGFDFLNKYGLVSMVTMQSWMFLGSYEKMRTKLLNSNAIVSMTHMDNMVMTIAFGTSATVWCKGLTNNYNARFNYVTMKDINTETFTPNVFPVRNDRLKTSNSQLFSAIPGKPIAYWISEKTKDAFVNGEKLGDIAYPRQGMATTNNNMFLRQWFEVENNNIGFNLNDEEDTVGDKKWFPYNKGGSFRRWYGNNDYVVNFKNKGKEVCAYIDSHSSVDHKGRVINRDRYFKESVTWSKISSGTISFRYKPNGFIFDVAGTSVFADHNKLMKLICLLNSNVTLNILSSLSPTLNFEVGQIAILPVLENCLKNEAIVQIAEQNIQLSKYDWDQYETSWDFIENPLIKINNSIWDTTAISATMSKYYGKPIPVNSPLELCYMLYKGQVNENFDSLKANEEELNKIFIDIYGLQDELTPEVADKDVTVARIYDRKEDIPEEMKNNSYVKTKEDVVKDLISYIVGCAFGRYSPYRDGLQFAGGKFDWDKYFNSIQDNEKSTIQNIRKTVNSFMPTYDNCLLISNNEYIENDLVSYVVDFIEKVYEPTKLEENLRFIADALDDSHKYTPRQVIRNYLFEDFFKDHCKKYQNRPIYWLMDSGKNGGFRALVYMHRFDENTLPTARFNYLHDIQWKYDQEKERLEKIIQNSSITSEKTKAKKELDLIDKQIVECRAYDEILNHATNMKIELDLDDGVKTNYNKLQKLDGDKDKNILSTYLKFKD